MHFEPYGVTELIYLSYQSQDNFLLKYRKTISQVLEILKHTFFQELKKILFNPEISGFFAIRYVSNYLEIVTYR